MARHFVGIAVGELLAEQLERLFHVPLGYPCRYDRHWYGDKDPEGRDGVMHIRLGRHLAKYHT